jgi:hypothetical protein
VQVISGITKLGTSLEVSAFCREQTRRTAEADCTLVVVLDADGYVIRVGSDAFPAAVRDDISDLINTVLRRIARNEGLQS